MFHAAVSQPQKGVPDDAEEKSLRFVDCAPSRDDIASRVSQIKPYQPTKPTAEEADAVLAANGIPQTKAVPPAAVAPCPGVETWSDAFLANFKMLRHFVELVGHAVIAVATPLLTAAVDGIGVLVVAVTVWEGWRPATALADAFIVWCGAK
jgi:hypothetical protein